MTRVDHVLKYLSLSIFHKKPIHGEPVRVIRSTEISPAWSPIDPPKVCSKINEHQNTRQHTISSISHPSPYKDPSTAKASIQQENPTSNKSYTIAPFGKPHSRSSPNPSASRKSQTQPLIRRRKESSNVSSAMYQSVAYKWIQPLSLIKSQSRIEKPRRSIRCWVTSNAPNWSRAAQGAERERERLAAAIEPLAALAHVVHYEGHGACLISALIARPAERESLSWGPKRAGPPCIAGFLFLLISLALCNELFYMACV